ARAVRRLGRLRIVESGARPTDRDPRGGAPGAPGLQLRSGRHAHRPPPAGVPRRGHLRPAACARERAGPARADRGPAAERALHGRRACGGPRRSGLAIAELREAHDPREPRGRGRDDVAMLVSNRRDGSLAHRSFRDLPRVLEPGDLLVVNTSATLPAALPATLSGRPVELRLSTRMRGSTWIVDLRNADGTHRPLPPLPARLDLPGDAQAEVGRPFGPRERPALRP